MAIDIRPISIPDRLGTPAAIEFEQAVEHAARIDEEIWGDRRLSSTPAEALASYRPSPYRERRMLGAWDGTRIVGRAITWLELDDEAVTGGVCVDVDPAFRRRGLGSRLLREGEEVLRQAGRSILVGYSDHPAASLERPGPRIHPGQGDASIPASDPAARFATRHGYRLEQLERMSSLDLAGRAEEFRARLARRLDTTSGYRLEQWTDRAPDGLVDAFAAACAHMATDVPAGGLTIDEERWDAARVREWEGRTAASGAQQLVTAAIADDGAVAGYTVIELPAGKRIAYQEDTLVLAAHRGRRLGMLVKLANLARLTEAAPDRVEVATWNADENAHMLAINLELGFRLRGLEAAWQKEHATAGSAGSGATSGS